MAQSIKHKRSSVVTNGSPKLPTTSQIEVGEIAINFAEGYETLSTRNNNNGIATFSSDAALDKKYISSGAVVSAISAVTKTVEDDEYVIAQAFNEQNKRLLALESAGFMSAYTETDPTVPSWAKSESKPTYTAAEVGAMATTERDNYLSASTVYFDDVEYDSGTKRINFKKSNTVVDYIDATDFIKDGMVSSVTVSGGNLVISFNTDAGSEDIELGLTQIFNPNNYYDKTTADGKFLTTATTIPTEADLIDSGFTKNALTAYTETDPVFTGSPACGITSQNIIDWSGKQDAILDLGDIRNGAASGMSAYGIVTAHTGSTTLHLPSVSSSDNGKILQVVDGQWTLVTPTVVYTGSGIPDNTLGNNGDIYLQTS